MKYKCKIYSSFVTNTVNMKYKIIDNIKLTKIPYKIIQLFYF